MDTTSIGLVGVAASGVLVVVAVAVSARFRLGLSGSIVWASVRAVVQLLAVGAALGLVLADDAPLVWSWLWVVAMVVIGGVVSAQRVREVPGLWWLSSGALGLAVAVSLAVVFGLGMLPLMPRTLVPAAGMLLGNSIASSVLVARRTVTELTTHRDRIETRLALGMPAPDAVRPQVRDALRTAITPQVETTKIVGIIALPGTMVGLLLAGVAPVDAVLLQAAVMLLILGSVAITTVVVGVGTAHRFTTGDQRVVVPSGPADTAKRSP